MRCPLFCLGALSCRVEQYRCWLEFLSAVKAADIGLGKVLASATFQSSQRLGEFLRFAVERTLSGEADQPQSRAGGVGIQCLRFWKSEIIPANEP